MMRTLFSYLFILALGGCAIGQKTGLTYSKPQAIENKMVHELDLVPAPSQGPLTVAVYSFKDQTGQRKTVPGIASFSTAVTQGAENFLIRALQDVGKGSWFTVVERSNLDDLIKERLIITQMRQAYDGKDAEKLKPLHFAGIILQGGIVGYDTGLESGGSGYNWLGIGPTTQYSKDVITISLRAVSVNTGKIVATVTVTKVIYSTSDTIAIFKSINPGSPGSMLQQILANNSGAQSPIAGIFQLETGLTLNEPTTIALKASIESCVIELIKEGERRGVWQMDYPQNSVIPWWNFDERLAEKSKSKNMSLPIKNSAKVSEFQSEKTSQTKSNISQKLNTLEDLSPPIVDKPIELPADEAAKTGVIK
jgi:curli production assembly/transport component CsgG